MRRRTGLVPALDVDSGDTAIDIARAVADFADAIKVGHPLVMSAGMGVIRRISEFTPVIADFKIADIPETNAKICGQAFGAGAGAVIVHGFTGRDSLTACIGVAREHGGEVFVVTEMSHPGAVEFMAPVAERLASLAVECCADGIVAPATRPERLSLLRKKVGSMAIISPGVGAQGGSAGAAIRAGADFVIVGRSIYQSAAPGKVAEAIASELQSAYEEKSG